MNSNDDVARFLTNATRELRIVDDTIAYGTLDQEKRAVAYFALASAIKELRAAQAWLIAR